MLEFTLEFDPKQLAEAEYALSEIPRQLPIAASAAVGRALTRARKLISVETQKQYTVPASAVKKSLSVNRTRSLPGQISGSLVSQGEPLHLSKFKVRNNKRAPVFVQVKKSGGKRVPGLFVHPSKSVLHRTQKTAYPLRIPYGPSVPQMVGNPSVLEIVAQEAQRTLNERLQVEVEYRLGGFGK